MMVMAIGASAAPIMWPVGWECPGGMWNCNVISSIREPRVLGSIQDTTAECEPPWFHVTKGSNGIRVGNRCHHLGSNKMSAQHFGDQPG